MEDNPTTVQQLCSDPSFVRWIEGRATQKEEISWNRWIQKSEQNRRLAMKAQQRISGFVFEEPELPDVEKEWNKVHHSITEEEKAEVKVTSLSKRKSWDAVATLFKVAAVLLLGVFVGFAAYMYQAPAQVKQKIAEHTVTTDYGEIKTLNLSDGSRIILAANSQLSYQENWLDKPVKRLRLEGEAYFTVAPKRTKGHPKLVVKTEDGTASVWGTRFTVSTNEGETRVVLEEGEVRVDNRKKDRRVTMKPGEMARFSKSSKSIELETVNPKVYTSWFTDELFFENTPLSVLVNRIERTYGVKVEVGDEEILQRKLSGSIDFKSLSGLTNAVEEIFNIHIQRSGETLIINNNCKEN